MRETTLFQRLRCLLGRHTWDVCVCRVCGKTRHEWVFTDTGWERCEPLANFMDEAGYYRDKCTRCGKWKT